MQPAELHSRLQRAFTLIDEVEEATARLRDGAHGFAPGDASTAAELYGTMNRRLDAALLEIADAASVAPAQIVETKYGKFALKHLRAVVAYVRAELEMACDHPESAKRLFMESIHIAELPQAHYMLGLIHARQDHPRAAITEFERYLQFAPDGEFRAVALREVQVLREARRRYWTNPHILSMFHLSVIPETLSCFFRRRD